MPYPILDQIVVDLNYTHLCSLFQPFPYIHPQNRSSEKEQMSWAYADSQKTLRRQQLKEEELRRKEEEDLARAIKESLKTAKKWQYSCPLGATIAVHTYHVQNMSQIEHAFPTTHCGTVPCLLHLLSVHSSRVWNDT